MKVGLSDSPKKTVAALDLGSNAFRLLVCEIPADGIIKPRRLELQQALPRLSGGFSPSFGLTKEAMDRSIMVLKQFRGIMDRLGVEEYKAVGTGVLRKAVNCGDFIKSAHTQAGIAIEVIDARKEALLTYEGVISASNSPLSYPVMILDVGGFSVECIHAEDPIKPSFMVSLDIGSVLLRERFLKSDPPSNKEIESLRAFIRENLGRLRYILHSAGLLDTFLKGGQLIGTAGTLTTLAQIDMALADYNPLLIQNYVLTQQRLGAGFEQLVKMTSKERLSVRGIKPGREDVIVAGALLVIETLKTFRKPGIVVSDAGLLEGLMEEMIADFKVSASDS